MSPYPMNVPTPATDLHTIARQKARTSPILQAEANRTLSTLSNLATAMCPDPEDRRKAYLITQQLRELLGLQ